MSFHCALINPIKTMTDRQYIIVNEEEMNSVTTNV
jgi:hypothetical protein